MSPKRIRQRRTKGWRKPEGAVSVTRATKRGNHYRIVPVGRGYAVKDHHDEDWGRYPTIREARARAVQLYRVDVTDIDQGDIPQIQQELAGKDLMCWCPLDQPCHADVLLELANGADS
ncbi:MAG: DUF4326 domain-containing protein [Brachybacterium sp.]|uniref:DUF4326 domain-containing protein n=1 Tax=Brachybacterium sp. TaxID=1891286 RepID=UPI0026490A5A|nr:DUF4326 domain-containing protein [Brachybacterium sp.]MDN5687100.1 DUF4326 domain-containing protein [Brachybacterium sp.]